MPFDCLKSAVIGQYLDNKPVNDPLRDAAGEVASPYVKVFFDEGDKPIITVGNKSTPGNLSWEHAAIVKSFDFGVSNGAGCKIEIMDTQNSSFSFFIQKMSKCITSVKNDFKMRVEWGWIVASCLQDGPPQVIPTNGTVSFLISNVESTFAEGKIKYILTGTDVMQHVFASRNYKIFGSEAQPMTLTQAMKQLASQEEPKFDVQFYKYTKDTGFNGDPIEWDGEKKKGEGPPGIWPSDGQNKLNTMRQWVEPFKTKNGKGVIFVWDTQSPTPKLNVLEDPAPKANEQGGDTPIIARYIVNGGACSPVLSFTPTLNWVSAMAALASGGNSGGPVHGETITKKDSPRENIQGGSTNVGTAQSIAVSRYGEYFYGVKNVGKETDLSQEAQRKANNMVVPVQAACKAQLRIQGDPRTDFIHSRYYMGRCVALAVLNPFHITGGSNSDSSTNEDCGDWLARPMCNEVLSNKRWRISGISHSIREGSYTTTLDLWLPVPGIDLPDGSKLGGSDGGSQLAIPGC